jgi:predicted nuclease of predicted toxin-antitoxin system
VRLLLDEMIAATVDDRLRARGHDVVAVQDAGFAQLRGIDDCTLLEHACQQRRAVVTDNAPDFFRCHQRRLHRGQNHYGLLLFTNDTLPRHRHDAFVGRIVVALDHELQAHPGDENSSWIRWLSSNG